MNPWVNTVLTDKGTALLAKLTQGNTLNITRAVTGAGFVTPGLLAKQTTVTDPKQALSFRAVTYPETGTCVIPVALTNDAVITGYEATQVGMYAEDPDEGEVLILLSQATDEKSGTIVPSATEMPGYSAEWNFYLRYGQAGGVNVTLNPAGSVSREEMQNYVTERLNEKANDIPITSTPEDDVQIWIDPDDDPDTDFYSKDEIDALLKTLVSRAEWEASLLASASVEPKGV